MPSSHETTFDLEEALKAQKALRDAAGMAPEKFPLPAFVGMISDEVQALREQGWTDERIAELIGKNSAIQITSAQLAENYASPEDRGHA